MPKDPGGSTTNSGVYSLIPPPVSIPTELVAAVIFTGEEVHLSASAILPPLLISTTTVESRKPNLEEDIIILLFISLCGHLNI